MTLPELLKDYARYNTWANEQLLNWLFSKPLELLEREIASSFPSLRLTLLHIWDAEIIWLQRLMGLTATTFPSAQFQGSAQDLKSGLLANSQDFFEFTQQCPEPFFQQSITYQNSKGATFNTPNTEVILHCLQHSTYHRGQLVTMARGLGLTDPPSTDFITYVRLRNDW